VVLHAAGDVVVLIRWWATGQPEWQLSATPPPLLAVSGVDARFITTFLVLLILATMTVVSYRKLRALRLVGTGGT
jgi:hypothetical protein